MFVDRLLLFACAELTKLKMQLEVPGSTGALTSAADRKLLEGQRVSDGSNITLFALAACDAPRVQRG